MSAARRERDLIFLAKDIKAWADQCDENVVVESPFTPEGSPAPLEGRTAVREYLKGYPDLGDVHRITSLTVPAADAPDTAVADRSVTGEVPAGGNPYEMSYATFVTFRDGKIVRYREFWNPLAFLRALGGGGF
ncbi:nuclear transport factor 2 family protein [Streptomyces sp. NPDC094038]|uniref:nuclear transport factor 2 family protein n=1 Tax=Streptomyces sp. NPDC094038 TaxID=3366055 RepID=UPI00380BFE57